MNRTCLASSLVLAALAVVALPNVAFAQTEEGLKTVEKQTMGPAGRNSPSVVFGGKSQLAISSDAGLSLSHTSITGGNGSSTSLVLRPAIDYFVVENLSLGGFLGLEYTHAGGGNSTAFSIGPRVGYNIPLSNLLSVWPKVGFAYSHTNIDVSGGGTGTSSANSLALNLFVPLMLHPAEHFFLGFGPALDVDLTGDPKATTIALRLTIGGWI
jgi:hypothetical protein